MEDEDIKAAISDLRAELEQLELDIADALSSVEYEIEGDSGAISRLSSVHTEAEQILEQVENLGERLDE